MTDTSISFQDQVVEFEALSDSEFLSRITWSESATKTLAAAAQTGDVAKFIASWQKSLTKRGLKKKAFRKQSNSFSLWSKYAFDESSGIDVASQLLENAFQKASKSKVAIGTKKKKSNKKKARTQADSVAAELKQWLANPKPNQLGSPFELLTLLELLSRRVTESDAAATWSLWRTTLAQAIRFADELHEPEGNDVAADQRLLITGELPWQIGLLFQDVNGAAEMAGLGRKVLRSQLEENTDTDGTPNANLLQRLPLWLAPLVRSTEFASLYDERLWDEDSADRFHDLVSIVAPMCDDDGRIALTNGTSNGMTSMLESAARVARLRKNAGPRDLLRRVTSQRPQGANDSVTATKPKGRYPVTQSDWAQLACLRSDWSAESNSIVIAHHQELPQLEFVAAGRQFFAGAWDIEVSIEGCPITLDEWWDCTCWNSDKDCDYLELQMTTDEDVRVDRQVLLSRSGEFAILADAISQVGEKRIDYRSWLPLAAQVAVETDNETRECQLTADKRSVRVFPLGLPQNHVQSTAGQFRENSQHIELTQVSSGHGLYAPIVIDWHPLRRRADVDWRTLTVTEERETLSSGIASGHRIRVGKHHLLLYRSLREPEVARAFLGHHTLNETVIGQFTSSGEVEPILLVE